MTTPRHPPDPHLMPEHQIVLVTGPSGAGKSTAIHAMEDLGFEVIDNLPLSLVPRLLDGPPLGRRIALVLDVRNRDFNTTTLIELIDTLTRDPAVSLEVLYLDCAASALIRRYSETRRRHPLGRRIALVLDVRNRDFNTTTLIELIDTLTRDPAVSLEVLYLDCAASALIRRYSETRRRHPLAPSGSPDIGIEREIDLLAPIRARADHLIDTSEMSPHDLKAEIALWFDQSKTASLAVAVQSFSYKRGIPRGVDMIFDCRFLRNPHWDAALRSFDGRDDAVLDHIAQDARFAPFYEKLLDLITLLLPAHRDEGKAHLTIGFGCTGGQHRSVAVAELLAKDLAKAGWPVSKRHLELERRAATALPDASRVSQA